MTTAKNPQIKRENSVAGQLGRRGSLDRACCWISKEKFNGFSHLLCPGKMVCSIYALSNKRR